MKTAVLLCLLSFFSVEKSSADNDPWASFFRQKLDSLLKEASANLPEEVNVTNANVTLVKHDDGWLSLRQGVLYNLSSWTRMEDVNLKCNTSDIGIVTTNVSFQDLLFSFSYWYDNGTSLGPQRNFTGTLSGLTGQIVFRVQKFPSYYYSTAAFRFNKEETSVSLTVFNSENMAVRKAEVARAVRRALRETILTRLEQQIGNILMYTIAEVDMYSVPRACTPKTTTVSTTSTFTTNNKITKTTPTLANTTVSTTSKPTTSDKTTKTTPNLATTTVSTTSSPTTSKETTKTAPNLPNTTVSTTSKPITSKKSTNTTHTLATTTPKTIITSKTATKETQLTSETQITSTHSVKTTKHDTNTDKTSSHAAATYTVAHIPTAKSFPNTRSPTLVIENENETANQENNFGDQLPDNSTAELNNIMNDLITKAGKHFPTDSLLPYSTPDTDDELYQKAEGGVMVNITLKGLRNLSISGIPHIDRMNKSARVTADVEFDGVKYSALLRLDSADSSWTSEGGVDQLTGQIVITVNYENTSAANISLDSFQLKPFVLLTGVPKISTRKQVNDEEVEDAVRGVFKVDVIPELSGEESALLKAAFQADRLDMESLLTTTTSTTVVPSTNTSMASLTASKTVPSTNVTMVTSNSSTNGPSTTSAPVPSTTPNSGSLQYSSQCLTVMLVSILPSLYALKMLLLYDILLQ